MYNSFHLFEIHFLFCKMGVIYLPFCRLNVRNKNVKNAGIVLDSQKVIINDSFFPLTQVENCQSSSHSSSHFITLNSFCHFCHLFVSCSPCPGSSAVPFPPDVSSQITTLSFTIPVSKGPVDFVAGVLKSGSMLKKDCLNWLQS